MASQVARSVGSVRSARSAFLLCLLAVLSPVAAAGPKIAVSIEPLAFFAERIAGAAASITVLVGSGQSPHVYEPTPKQLAAVSSASLFFGVGMPFETRLVGKIARANPTLSAVDVTGGISLLPMGGDVDHDHEHAGANDPHVWLDPLNAKIIAQNMATAMCQADPANGAAYDKNLETLLADLDALHGRIVQTLAPFKGRTFYVYHPAFGYFADAYGLVQKSVEISGKEPTARQLAEFIEQAQRENVRVVFVQRQFPARVAESIAREIGGTVIPIDPLARDYIKNLEEVAAKMQQAWQG